MAHVLLTGGRAPATLELARLLSEAGHRVSVAESWNSTVTGWSNRVSGRFLVPSPRFEFSAFAERLAKLVRTHLFDLLIPTCEEIFWVARAKDDLEPFTRVFCPPLDDLRRMHDKAAFASWAASLGMSVPETRMLAGRDDVEAVASESRHLVFKPVFSRFGTRALIRPSAEAARRLRPSASEPWVAQAFVAGREVCAYSVLRAGRVRALAVYESRYRAGRASVVFEAERHGGVRAWVEDFAARGDLSGQFAFDFIEDARGEVWALECNPRLTSGIHLLRSTKQAANVFFEDGDLVEPRADVRAALKAAMLGGAILKPGGFAAFARSRDVLFEVHDPAPALAQPLLTAHIAARAWRAKTSLLGATTHDIQWDGEA